MKGYLYGKRGTGCYSQDAASATAGKTEQHAGNEEFLLDGNRRGFTPAPSPGCFSPSLSSYTFESRMIVTGPSLTRATSMEA